ncbi:multiheme c-type cytochrome [Alloalcanivorax xenomutans]|uniref:multiheme c-type cytochrome n=1 Tax=Alloalcanivorax xenomutans TaxID=1094342 RepID=UPI00292CBA36|nr:tetratricopeptide repeat protein [Alloalcanivorax xenomutans]WOA30507.1 multiheme c-type cytochrome [Alloalcanivorax xenomutans]
MRIGIAVALVVALAGVLVAVFQAPWRGDGADPVAAHWVDEAQCGQCHQAQVRDWHGSHHHRAMTEPTDQTVRGAFDGTGFVGETQSSVFFRKDGEFWIRTRERDGEPEEHKVAYTFGWEPLQQYLLETEGGRLQAYGVAWDTQTRSWFHLYDRPEVDERHPLHWRQPAQNANFICIECHTSGFQRGYDAAGDRFDSHWRALGVGCQSCHGPASRHLQWTRAPAEAVPGHGFEVPLTDAARASEVDTCARCHSRRAPLGDGARPGAALRDDYRVTGLSADLYEVDGTIRDEVFEYGAFVQSRMHAAGVVCSDCHNAHSGALRAPGNAVCTQCHNGTGEPVRPAIRGDGLRAGDYDSPAHHHHAAGSPGAQCQACHMPGKVYMGNDLRHDHGFTSPDPAQARALGHDDACLQCHAGEPEPPLIDAFRRWYPEHQPRGGGYARALFKARGGEAGAARALFEQLARRDLPAVRRAALLSELPAYPSARARQAVLDGLADDAAAVREAAVPLVPALLPPGEMVAALQPLLTDPVRAVRLAAAWQWLQASGGSRHAPPPAWQEEYEAVQQGLLERADAHFNLANLYLLTGRQDRVEAALREALRRDPAFFPATVLLAQWLEQYKGEADRARALLREQIARYPDEASLRHALGLSRVRHREHGAALAAFQAAHRLAPDNGDYAYVLAIALHDGGQPRRARQVLRQQLRAHPADRSLRLALLNLLGDRPDERRVLLAELREQNPWDPVLSRQSGTGAHHDKNGEQGGGYE